VQFTQLAAKAHPGVPLQSNFAWTLGGKLTGDLEEDQRRYTQAKRDAGARWLMDGLLCWDGPRCSCLPLITPRPPLAPRRLHAARQRDVDVETAKLVLDEEIIKGDPVRVAAAEEALATALAKQKAVRKARSDGGAFARGPRAAVMLVHGHSVLLMCVTISACSYPPPNRTVFAVPHPTAGKRLLKGALRGAQCSEHSCHFSSLPIRLAPRLWCQALILCASAILFAAVTRPTIHFSYIQLAPSHATPFAGSAYGFEAAITTSEGAAPLVYDLRGTDGGGGILVRRGTSPNQPYFAKVAQLAADIMQQTPGVEVRVPTTSFTLTPKTAVVGGRYVHKAARGSTARVSLSDTPGLATSFTLRRVLPM
jgi:hypothetical protein